MTIEIHDVKSNEDGPFRSYDLFAEGETLDELLDSATYCMIDQDGEERGMISADDKVAIDAITQKWIEHEVTTKIPGATIVIHR